MNQENRWKFPYFNSLAGLPVSFAAGTEPAVGGCIWTSCIYKPSLQVPLVQIPNRISSSVNALTQILMGGGGGLANPLLDVGWP